jgi:predicted anti-sigma-YlaC factor YlaD
MRSLDDDVTLPERRRLESHIAECAACREERETLHELDRLLAAWATSNCPVPASTQARIAASVERRHRLRALRGLSRMTPAAVGSSLAAVLVLLSVNLGFRYGSSPGTNQPYATPARPSVIQKQSAVLSKARRMSALFAGREDAQPSLPLRRHIQLDVN